MSFNRLVDQRYDAANPRTQARALPAGLLSRRYVIAFTAVSAALLMLAAWQLNPLCFALSPVALAVVFLYSYTKRFTAWSHLVLGFSLGMAPAAAWIAVRGRLDPEILLLTAAVMLWTAGFDVIYACQDIEFDRSAGLYSLPRRVGVARALAFSMAMHAAMLVLLVILALLYGLGWPAFAGLGVVALLLAYEHSLVKSHDLSRVNAAFFTANGFVSIALCAGGVTDVLAR